MKTIIYSCHINSNYIELQYKSIKKFFQSEFEYIVFNDSKDYECLTGYNKIHTENIVNICNKLNIKHIRVPQALHDNRSKVLPKCHIEKDHHAVTRCSLACQYGLNYITKTYKNNYLLLIDCDMFFIDYFNINNYMNNYDISGVSQSRGKINYLWNGLFICDLEKCKNFEIFNWEAGDVNVLDKNNNETSEKFPCDVGGYNYHYLKIKGYLDEKKNKVKHISNCHILNLQSVWYRGERGIQYLSERIKKIIKKFHNIPCPPAPVENYINKEILLDKTVIHIRGGGGWCYHKKEYHLECVKIIEELINE